MFKSIRHVLFLSFSIVGLSLVLIVFLGIWQTQLTRQYREITGVSEQTLFRFSTIREQVTESLISGDYHALKDVLPDVETLNSNISIIYDSSLVPGQYKLAMAERIDLSGLALALRKAESEPDRTAAGLNIQQEFRRLSDNLIKVDRIITTQIRESVVSFQLGIIGVMGVLLSCASFILIILYRRGIKPLLDLSAQLAEFEENDRELVDTVGAGEEILRLTRAANGKIKSSRERKAGGAGPGTHDLSVLSETVNETANGLNGMINYAQLLLEIETDLTEEQKNMLEQIIDNGERVAGRWQSIAHKFSIDLGQER